MKRILLFLIGVTLSSSCTSEPKEFRGFGGLDIGADFKSLPKAKDFEKIMGDEFYIARYKISDAIGVVSNLNVSLQDGKISEVRFLSTTETDTTEIRKVTRLMTKPKMEIATDFLELYVSSDEKIFFIIERGKGFKSRYPKHITKYCYLDQEAVVRNEKETMARITKPIPEK